MGIMNHASIIPATLAFATVGASYLLAKRGFPKGSTVLDFGRGQQYCRRASAAETILRYITVPAGSRMNIMTDDFQKWVLSNDWMRFVRDRLDAGVEISVFAAGDANKKVPEDITNLSKGKKLEIIACGDLPFGKHFTTVSSPQQIWYEEQHVGHFADNCVYTQFPHKDTWKQIEAYFNSLRKEAA